MASSGGCAHNFAFGLGIVKLGVWKYWSKARATGDCELQDHVRHPPMRKKRSGDAFCLKSMLQAYAVCALKSNKPEPNTRIRTCRTTGVRLPTQMSCQLGLWYWLRIRIRSPELQSISHGGKKAYNTKVPRMLPTEA